MRNKNVFHNFMRKFDLQLELEDSNKDKHPMEHLAYT